jgi:hypothetical protein
MSGWWADTDGPNAGDVDSVHIPFGTHINEFLPSMTGSGPRHRSSPPSTNPPSKSTPNADPCAGNKGKIDPNRAGYPGAGLGHVSDRHIDPQDPTWVGSKSYFELGAIFTKGSPSWNKTQREQIVLDILQDAFEKGAANRLSRGDYAYSYAPYYGVDGYAAIDFIGRDQRHNYDTTNVRTVVLRITGPQDCTNPLLITGYPGLSRPRDSVNGVPTWVSNVWKFPF